MFATGFSMQPERIAEDEGGPSETFLLEQAREHGTHLVASIAQRGPDGNYRNNAVLATPAGEVHRYPKIHPFSYAGEHERCLAGRRKPRRVVERDANAGRRSTRRAQPARRRRPRGNADRGVLREVRIRVLRTIP